MSETKKRKDLLTLGKEALDAIKATFQVKKDKKDLEKHIIELEQKVAEADLTIQECKGSEKFDVDKITDAIDEKELTQRRLAQAKELEKELF